MCRRKNKLTQLQNKNHLRLAVDPVGAGHRALARLAGHAWDGASEAGEPRDVGSGLGLDQVLVAELLLDRATGRGEVGPLHEQVLLRVPQYTQFFHSSSAAPRCFVICFAVRFGGAVYRFPWLMIVEFLLPLMAYISQCV